MSSIQLLFCDYLGFLEEVNPFIEAVDKGETQGLLDYGLQTAKEFTDKDWMLYGDQPGLGSTLGVWSPGEALITILGKYLFNNPFGYRSLGSVNVITSLFGMLEGDIKLMREKMSLQYMIKPEEMRDPITRLPARDNRWYDPKFYWWWFRPSHAYETGWLNLEQIEHFHREFLKNEDRIDGATEADIQKYEYTKELGLTISDVKEDFNRAIKLFRAAIEANCGLLSNSTLS